MNKHPEATERLIELAEQIKGQKTADGKAIKNEEWRTRTLSERLNFALIKGNTEYLEADLAEALTVYTSPVEIIEGPLMQGMDKVGTLFGEGKMFLPQVVKSAKAMKAAVAILQPDIRSGKIQFDVICKTYNFADLHSHLGLKFITGNCWSAAHISDSHVHAEIVKYFLEFFCSLTQIGIRIPLSFAASFLQQI